jgi:hypothetical protein
LGGLPKGVDAVVVIDQSRKRDEPGGSRDIGDDEPVEVVEHGTSNDLAEGSVVSTVGLLHRSEIGASLFLEHNHWWVSEAHEDQIQGEAPCSAVAVEEWVNSLEVIVKTS